MAWRRSGKSGRTAVCGVLAAGSLALLWLACLAPSGRLGLTAAAGLFPMAAVLAGGRTAGYLCWAAAGLLGLVLLPDKGIGALFCVFFGVYPVIKSRLESLNRVLEWTGKLAFFNVTLVFCCRVLEGVFRVPILLPWDWGWALHAAGSGVFIVYDLGLSQLAVRLWSRTRRRQDHW